MNKIKHLQEIESMGFRKRSAANAIRRHCYYCQNNNWYGVNKCNDTECDLWAFRFGYNPFSKKGKIRMNHNPNSSLCNTPPPRVVGGVKLKETGDTNDSQITKVVPGASVCVKTKKLTTIKKCLLYFIYDKLTGGDTVFYKSEIETLHMRQYHTAETKARKYRELNAQFDLSECINRHKSKHLIKKTVREVSEILRSYGL